MRLDHIHPHGLVLEPCAGRPALASRTRVKFIGRFRRAVGVAITEGDSLLNIWPGSWLGSLWSGPLERRLGSADGGWQASSGVTRLGCRVTPLYRFCGARFGEPQQPTFCKLFARTICRKRGAE